MCLMSGPLHWPGDYKLCAGEARGGGRILCSSTAGFHHAEEAWLRKQLGIGRFAASGANSAEMNDRFNEQEIKSKGKIMSTNITKKLAGKVALVTGGSRSIGAAIAKRLATDGAAVALTYSASPDKANEVVRSIEAAGERRWRSRPTLPTPKPSGWRLPKPSGHSGPLIFS